MDIDLWKKCGKPVSYHNGEIICREGEKGKSLYILLQGTVEVTIDSYSSNPKSLGCMNEGSFFGEMSLLENKPRSATVAAASEDVTVMEIDREDLPMLIQNGPSITFRMFLTLRNRLNRMLDSLAAENKKFVFQYKKNPLYQTTQKVNVRDFDEISKRDPDSVWEMLKFLSSSLEKLNQTYIDAQDKVN